MLGKLAVLLILNQSFTVTFRMCLTCKYTVFRGQESSSHPEFAVRTVGFLLCLLRLVDQLLDCFLGQLSGAVFLDMHHLPADFDLVHTFPLGW